MRARTLPWRLVPISASTTAEASTTSASGRDGVTGVAEFGARLVDRVEHALVADVCARQALETIEPAT
jgi:hypothetical protein